MLRASCWTRRAEEILLEANVTQNGLSIGQLTIGILSILVILLSLSGSVEAQCVPSWTITGVITDTLGIPLPGIDIDLISVTSGVSLPLTQDFSEVDGSFVTGICGVVPAGLYEVLFSPPTGSTIFPASVETFIGSSINLGTITLEGGFLVTGTVVGEFGNPIEEADLKFTDSLTGTLVPFSGEATAADGSFSVLVTPGIFDIEYRQTATTQPTGVYVPVLHSEQPIFADLAVGTVVLRDGYELSGTITDNLGLPLLGADIDVRNPNTGVEILLSSDLTDLMGEFSVLVPTGNRELEIEPPNGSSLVSHLLLVDLQIPGPFSIGVVSLPLGVTVFGSVQDTLGSPVSSVDLDFLISSSGLEIPTADDNADVAGNFSVTVVPDTYDIQFKPPFPTGFAPTVLELISVTSPTNLGSVVLPLGVALTGTVTDSGSPVEGARVTLATGGVEAFVFGNESGANGDFALRQVPGVYDVTVTPPLGGAGTPVTLFSIDLSTDQVLNVDISVTPSPPPVIALSCSTTGSDVSLTWTNGALDYSALEIERDGLLIATMSGSATSMSDTGVPDGNYTYSVRALRMGLVSPDQDCIAFVGPPPPPQFLRGDSNVDGAVNIADAIETLNGLFVNGIPLSTCADAQDANDDGVVNIADAIFTLGFLFIMGPPPPPPFPIAGSDPTADSLDCL